MCFAAIGTDIFPGTLREVYAPVIQATSGLS